MALLSSTEDDYTLKNISTVVEFYLSLPGTNAAGEKCFQWWMPNGRMKEIG
jgi:hypothetical protein